jgi:hypothetical protein
MRCARVARPGREREARKAQGAQGARSLSGRRLAGKGLEAGGAGAGDAAHPQPRSQAAHKLPDREAELQQPVHQRRPASNVSVEKPS